MTSAGGWNVPTMFFAPAWSMATFPPSDASTMASSVVGTLTSAMPRA
jgi:hypothetical protein